MFWQLVLVAIALLVSYYMWKRRRINELFKALPNSGLTAWPILGHAYLFAGSDEDRMRILQKVGEIALKLGTMTSFWMANKLYVVIADPINADIVLKNCLDKDDTTMRYFRCLSGNGTIFAPVRIWRPRRKILAPMFSINSLNLFVPVFADQSAIMVQHLQKKAGKGDFSFWKYIATYTFDAICKTALDIDLKSQQNADHPFLEAFDEAIQMLSQRLCSPWLYLDCIYERLARYKTFVKNRDVMHVFIDEIIKKKKKELAAQNLIGMRQKAPEQEKMRSFLEMMIESSGGEKGFTELELREEVFVILVAGTDTSAVGAAYTALMLARYPEVQKKVYQELQEIFGDSNRPATVHDLTRLKYLEAVVKESLRLYPAVPVIVREAFDDLKLPSTTLVNGVGILINIWALHRNPEYWGNDVEQFRPERFLEAPLKHPAQFIPFSYSMRNCTGSTYAMMSMKIVLSTMIRRYRVLPPSDLEPEQWTEPLRGKFVMMMKHADNYIIRIEERSEVKEK